MKWLLVLLAILAAAISGATVGGGVVFACSCGNECDQILARTDVIVEGRVTSWRQVGEPAALGQFETIAVQVDVERTHRGPGVDPVTMFDRASLLYVTASHEEAHWAGGSGGCGSFDADPTGTYVLAALTRHDDGRLYMNRLQTLFIGEEPTGKDYLRARAFLADRIGAPAAGSGLTRPRDPEEAAGLFIAGCVCLLVSLGCWLKSRSRGHRLSAPCD